MKKLLIPLLFVAAVPSIVAAITVPWDRPSVGVINPLYVLDQVRGNYFTATSTTQASTFPYASTTALSVGGLTSGRCVQTGTGGLLTITGAACDTGGGTVTQINTTYPITGGPITTTGTISLDFGTTTSNTWAGTQTFTNSPVFSTLTAGTVNSTSGGTIYSTGTSTPTVTSPITYSGTLGSFIGGVSGTFACATCVTTATASSTITGTQGQVVYMQGTDSPIGTSTLFIAATSNVGVGTTSPTTRLSVQGNTFISGNLSNVANITATGTLTLSALTNKLLGTDANGLVVGTTSIGVNYLTGVLPIANGGTNASAIGSHLILTFDGTRIVASSTPVATRFVATSSVASILPYASSTSLSTSLGAWFATTGGSVGIGTVSPAEKLEITGNLRLSAGETRAISVSKSTVTSATGTDLYISAGDYEGSANVAGGNIVLNGGEGNSALGSYVLLATLRGKVGIATTSPTTALTIQGASQNISAFFGNNASCGAPYFGLTIGMKNDSACNTYTLLGDGTNTFLNGVATVRLRIGNGEMLSATALGVAIGGTYGALGAALPANGLAVQGNVGIGTTTPALYNGSSNKILSISGSSNPGIIFENSTASSHQFFLYNSGGTLGLRIFDASAAADRLTIDNDGDVGIGDATPSSKLSINGNIGFEPTGNQVAGTGVGLTWFRNSDSWNPARIEQLYTPGVATYAAALLFNTNNGASAGDITEKMRLTGNGRLGIGTTTPFSPLHVSKGANATTTITIGEMGLTTSKACVNMNRSDGNPASFFINAAGTMVVQTTYCQ